METLKSLRDSFNNLNKWVKVVLLVIPFVGWLVEMLIRWVEFAEDTSNVLKLVIAIVYTVCGWAWVLTVIDAVLIALDKKMLFVD